VNLRRLLPSLVATLTTTIVAAAGLSAVGAVDGLTADTAAAEIATAAALPAYALPDGLARTPPMGFNNWNSTHCRAEFNEEMIKGIADIFVERGLKDAGYQYVNIDDCWALPQRDAQGNLVPDPERFPSGIKALADYVHGKGLKFGIYTSAGTMTCNSAGFPGSLGHERADAALFASWGVDYLKYDNCNNQGVDAIQRYTAMRDALKATGRPIVYSICEWGTNDPWLWGKDVGHLWRTTGDINDSWSSVLSIIQQNLPLAEFAGPGHWNDPDMLEVGNGGMTATEYRTHFGMWAIMAAPLLIGSDLREASQETLDILGNREVIAVDQDPLGVQGSVLKSTPGDGGGIGTAVVVKPLAGGDRAVALFNGTDSARRIGTSAAEIGLPRASAYRLRDLWAHTDRHTAGAINATVPAHGTTLLRVSADPAAVTHPPAVDLGVAAATAYPGGPALAAPGETATVETAVTNDGLTPARRVSTRLTGSQGWPIEPATPPSRPTLPGGGALRTAWSVEVPEGTPPGAYALDASLTWRPTGDRGTVTERIGTPLTVPPRPPTGTAYASDVPWLAASSGWGPVEKDTSNGEQAAGDGNPITINGIVYAKGLGVHAPSTVSYYTGGRCSTVTGHVGVDDEEGAAGSVAFEVWADGGRVAESGVMTNAMPSRALTADVAGASVVRLVVTDGGDGVNNDHGDWADVRLTCA
jgi:alpha-galactosidase